MSVVDLMFVGGGFLILLKGGVNVFIFLDSNFVCDKLSFLLAILSFWLFLVIFLLAYKYKITLKLVFKYKIYIFFLMGFLVFSVIINELLGFYIFFEISLVPLIFIILGWGYQVERVQAFFYLFLYTMFGSLPLLFFFLMVYGGLSLDWLSLMFFKTYRGVFWGILWGVLSLAFLIKLPLYGFHLWLPKAHVEAPVSGSMVLAAVLLKLSLYGFYRSLPLLKISFFLCFFILVLLLWGALLSRLICLRQTDIKSLIAYSSVGHMGIIIRGVFFFRQLAVKGSFVIIIVHGFCSAALFYLVNFHYERTFSRQIFNNRGLFILYSLISSLWFFFLVVNFSAPPFISLIGEIAIYIVSLIKHVSFILILGFTRFVVASFCVYLFTVVVHGGFSKMLVLQAETDVVYLVLIFHLIPCFFLVFTLDFLWF